MANIPGTNGDDDLLGTDDDDNITAQGGNDSVAAGDGDDRIEAGAGDDLPIAGEDGEDTIFGGPGNDQLSGGDDDDRLSGQGGSDTLGGGTGDDSLNGGAGTDTFNINPNEDQDTITGFVIGQDTIAINGFSNIQNFNDLSAFIDTSQGNNSVIDLGDAQNGQAGVQVVTLVGVQGLTAGDFDFNAGQIQLFRILAPDPGV